MKIHVFLLKMKSRTAQTVAISSKNALLPLNRQRMREAQIQTDDQACVQVCYNEELSHANKPVDACTQLDEGALFDFDAEVEPYLETLVGRAISEAKNEYRRDQYLVKLQKKRRDFERKREEQEALLKHLEQIEEEKQIERTRTCEQRIAILSISESAISKLSSHKHAKSIFGNICENGLETLRNARVFEPPRARYIQAIYIPALIKDATVKLRNDNELNLIRYDYLPTLLDVAKEKASQN